MTDNIENLNEITSDYGMSYDLQVKTKKEHKDIIREILMTMPDKNGYYSPPYK